MTSIMTDVLNYILSEDILTTSLQKQFTFTLKNKVIKRGKLILFKKVHYHLQLTLLNNKGNKENFEIPIPFKTEYHHSKDENVLYFDYRISTLSGNDKKIEKVLNEYRIKNIEPSQYFNSILEIIIK